MLDAKHRIEYARANRSRYLDWSRQLAESPYSWQDKLEFALLSAHTPMAHAIKAFETTRYVMPLSELSERLEYSGIIAPYRKALYLANMRDDALDKPQMPYRAYRKEHKINGLGYCKLSFGLALIDPLLSDVCCLDTHILQLLLDRMPYTKEVNQVYRSLPLYEHYENVLDDEAKRAGLPLFPYQWAIWDYKRRVTEHAEPNDHSFLWQSGKSRFQLPLFSSLL